MPDATRKPERRPEAADEAGDEALMLAYAAGDAGAFDRLYARHRGGVYRYLLRHVGNAATADELFQDVWMNAIRARATYAPTAKFSTWIYTLARHRLVDHWRSRGNVRVDSLDDDCDGETGALVDAIPYCRFLGIEIDRKGNELTTILRFDKKLIGNPILPALHGGVVGAFLEVTAVIQLMLEAGTEDLPKPVDIGIDYLRSGRPVDAYARATITKHGRRWLCA